MMTVDEAGRALAADPTFRLMSREEQEDEAARLLGTFNEPCDDPLEVALAIEAAESAAAAAPLTPNTEAPEPGLEPCRLNGVEGPPCNGDQPIAGNGRCMTCGAVRKKPDAPERPETAPTAPIAAPAPSAPPATVSPASEALPGSEPAKLRHGVTYDPGASFIGRFKEATGATDREVSGMLGMSRATAQAYAGGRLAEKLDTAQARVLIDDLAERLLLLADLKRDLHAAIGEVD